MRVGGDATSGVSGKSLTLIEHLVELRHRLLVSLASVAVVSIGAFLARDQLIHFLAGPYCSQPVAHRLTGPEGSCTLVVTGVLDGFSIAVRLSLYTGLIVSSPVWLWQIWRFVTPGMHRNERRTAVGFTASVILMFSTGAVVAFVTLGKGLQFLLGVVGDSVIPLLTVNRYFAFLFAMVLVFGLAFEFPVLLLLLNRVGVLPAAKLRSWRRQAIFGVFLFAAVATPSQDPFTMSALAVPMCLFYELAVVLARVHDRRVSRRRAVEDATFGFGLT